MLMYSMYILYKEGLWSNVCVCVINSIYMLIYLNK